VYGTCGCASRGVLQVEGVLGLHGLMWG
jgi:hypothetical protein